MLEIVRVFRALIGATVVLGLLVIFFGAAAIAEEEGPGVALVVGFFAAAFLIMSVGIAATLLLATDYLKEVRDELKESSRKPSSSLPAGYYGNTPTAPNVSSTSRTPAYNANTGHARTKVKTYKGYVIERGQDGAIYVGDKPFKGLLSAEKYVDGL